MWRTYSNPDPHGDTTEIDKEMKTPNFKYDAREYTSPKKAKSQLSIYRIIFLPYD
jgi:hypothetical protein